jgi:hypothetical protein
MTTLFTIDLETNNLNEFTATSTGSGHVDGVILLGDGSANYTEITRAGVMSFVGNAKILIPTKTPASATDTGTAGEICYDGSYLYICTAANTWRRAAIGSW